MKKKKNNWLKIILITGVILFAIVELGIIIANTFIANLNDLNNVEIDYYFNEYVVQEQSFTEYVKGTGIINSFNIKSLDTSEYSEIKEIYVNEGTIVNAKQKIMRGIKDGISQIIYSPINGMYFEDVENKSYLLYDLSNIGIEMYVTENDVAKISVNQKAIVRISAINKNVDGVVTYVSKLPSTNGFKVRIKIDYNDEIKFGYGASVKVIVSQKDKAIVIPYNALQMDKNNNYYVVKKEYKESLYNNYYNDVVIPEEAKTYVKIGSITGSLVEITSGLNIGDTIVEWKW